MKKTLLTLLASVMMIAMLFVSFTSCGGGGEEKSDDSQECAHVDADDNSLCDKCGDEFTDGKDLPNGPGTPTCDHRDADDNSLCDKCGDEYSDGVEHVHSFTQKIVDKRYRASGADCENAEKYYYSCLCGDAGTETFASGEANGHSYTVKNTDSKYLATEADCDNAATYYFSCHCGEAGTETFASGEASFRHTNADGACAVCGLPESSAGLEFELNADKKSYTLVGIGSCNDADIVIGSYNGYSVTSIGFSAFWSFSISHQVK